MSRAVAAESAGLLIAGNPAPFHVGAHMLRAAEEAALETVLCDTRHAFDAAWPLVKLNWWLRGRRPPRLHAFGKQVLATCRSLRPMGLLATGMAPLDGTTLEAIGRLGIVRMNFLTDDPWNPHHQAGWFQQALPRYDWVFTPRRSIMNDLARAGCKHIAYVPFAYAPEAHFPEPITSAEEQSRFASDVVFAGGGDRDRVPFIGALIRAGLRVALYGGYWEHIAELRPYARGHADLPTLRKAIAGAKIALCLVRRANRDGHVMRTFEVPAMGGCMLTEDTEEHREIFGPDGASTVYFRTIPEMIERARWLLDHEQERRRLAAAAHALILTGHHSYRDRLETMLALATPSEQPAGAHSPIR